MGKNWSLNKQFVPRKKCIVCGIEFYSPPCMKKRSENAGKFCSRKCYGSNLKLLLAEKYRDLRLQKTEQAKSRIENKKQVKINNCVVCGSETKRKYCSLKCRSTDKTKKVKFSCLNCGKEFLKLNWQYKKNVHNYCSVSCYAQLRVKTNPMNVYSRSKGGKREDLDNRYFRSRWEANYARYLNFLIDQKQIIKWEYEPDTFIFDKIKRGTISYLPDFKVFHNDGTIEYHEVKGYNSPKSITKLKRMAKYYPEVKIVLIDKVRYKVLHSQLKSIIKNWEVDNNKKHEYK